MLETLSRFNTVGKLRNLRLTALDIRDGLAGREALRRAELMLQAVEQVQPLTTYLAEAQANMPDHDALERAGRGRAQRLLRELRKGARGETAVSLPDLLRDLQALKADYITAYAAAHRHSVLGPDEDAQRREMMTGARWQALKALVAIDLLAANKPEMDGWGQAMTNLRVCTAFHEGLLADSPTCTCRFRPREASSRPPANCWTCWMSG
jgi:hypothetical protein